MLKINIWGSFFKIIHTEVVENLSSLKSVRAAILEQFSDFLFSLVILLSEIADFGLLELALFTEE